MGTPYDQDTGIPIRFTEFASGEVNNREPTAGKKNLGWVFKKAPASNYENWMRNNSYRWEKYFERLFDNIIPYSGMWEPPSVSVTGGIGDGTMPEFTIGAFVVTSESGQRLPFAGGVFTTAGLVRTANPFRVDAVYWVLTEGLDEWEWEWDYIEDVFGAGAASVTSYHNLLFFVTVEFDAANYKLAETSTGSIICPPKMNWHNNHVVISGHYWETIGEYLIGIVGIQAAIDSLADRQGGVVEVIGDWHGKEDWDVLADPIKVKSGVLVKSGIRSLITSSSDNYNQAAISSMFEMTGYAGTIDFPVGSDDDIEDTTDAAQNFADFGRMSLLQIDSGPNAGFYLFKDFVVVGADPATQFRGATIVTMDREPVTWAAVGISAPYKVWIYRAGIVGLSMNVENMPAALNQSPISLGYTYDCQVSKNIIKGTRAVVDFDAGIDCREGPNTRLDLTKNEIDGSFLYGILSDVTEENEKCRILHNIIDVSSVTTVNSDGIDFRSSSTGDNQVFDNMVVAKGLGTKELYNGNAGWQGYPATEEHNENGTHKDDIIGPGELNVLVAGAGITGGGGAALSVNPGDGIELAGAGGDFVTVDVGAGLALSGGEIVVDSDAVVPAMLADRSMWLLASIPCKDDATAVSTGPIARDVQLSKDGLTNYSVDYRAGAAFSIINGAVPFEIRKNANGEYQLRVPGIVSGGGAVFTPLLAESDVVLSLIPLSTTGRLIGMSWNNINKFWTIDLAIHDGTATDTAFQIMIFGTN